MAGERLGLLYLRAAASALPLAGKLPFLPGGGGSATGLRREQRGLAVDPARLAAYRQLCGFADRQELPPTYPHVLAFPLQLAVLCDGRFPFSPLGLVHLENKLELRGPLEAGERYDLAVWAEGPVSHRRGLAVTVYKEAAVGGEVRWRERSVFLRLQQAAGGGGGGGSEQPGGEPVGELVAPAEIGRRYAAVSGDRNPIHTHAAAARLFGFRGPIAHGMWVKARALAALGDRLPEAYTCTVRFRSPLYLPGRATVRLQERDGRLALTVVGGEGKTHLEGEVVG